jgi:mRNA interferase MazF
VPSRIATPSVTASDFTDGSLRQDSNIRPDRLFTADSSLILYRAGGLSAAKVQEVITKIVELITA